MRMIGALLGLLLLGSLPAASLAQTVVVEPSEGWPTDRFTVRGCGFDPGIEIVDSYVSPDGEIFEFFFSGEPTILIADEAGCILDTVIPADDFVGARDGLWQFWICVGGTTTCWVADLTIHHPSVTVLDQYRPVLQA